MTYAPVQNVDDGDDADVDVHPNATEVCNSIDDNCDGNADAEDAIDRTVWYADTDGDGEGDGDGYGDRHKYRCRDKD